MVPEQLARQAGHRTDQAMGMISGTTSLIGLLGQPVHHSLSPVMQNAALTAMNLDWCYMAMPCETNDLANVLCALRSLNCLGLNITIPHKQDVAKTCRELSPLAKRLKAVNTLIPHADGGWTGTNTDVAGFIAPLQESKCEWHGRRAVVLGCGGSARAVVAGLQDLKLAQIMVVGRRSDALKRFLDDLQPNPASSESDCQVLLQGILQQDPALVEQLTKADLVVNTTPVGMSQNRAETSTPRAPMPLGKKIWQNLSPKTTLYDLIYTPKPTAWLTLGTEHGCHCIDGLEMLVQQGAASLRLWSGNNQVPIEEMRKAALGWLTL